MKGEWRIVILASLLPPEPTLGEVKAQKIAELEMLWGEKMAEGYVSKQIVGKAPLKVKVEPMGLSMFSLGVQVASKGGKLPLLRDYEGVLHRDVPATVLASLVEEINAPALSLWTKKVLLQEKAKLAKTAEEVASITWETEVSK